MIEFCAMTSAVVAALERSALLAALAVAETIMRHRMADSAVAQRAARMEMEYAAILASRAPETKP